VPCDELGTGAGWVVMATVAEGAGENGWTAVWVGAGDNTGVVTLPVIVATGFGFGFLFEPKYTPIKITSITTRMRMIILSSFIGLRYLALRMSYSYSRPPGKFLL